MFYYEIPNIYQYFKSENLFLIICNQFMLREYLICY